MSAQVIAAVTEQVTKMMAPCCAANALSGQFIIIIEIMSEDISLEVKYQSIIRLIDC